MKKCLPGILGLLFIFFTAGLSAQQKEQAIRFVNGDFVTGSNIRNHTFTTESIAAALYGDLYFVLLQFEVLPSDQEREKMSREGITLCQYFPGNAYEATIKKAIDFYSLKKYHVTSVNAIPGFYKIDRQIADYKPTTDKQQTQLMVVECFPFADKKMLRVELQQAGAVIQSTKYDGGNIIFIQSNPLIADKIAAIPFVANISLQTIIDRPLNYSTIGAQAVSGLQALNGKNLNGKGVAIGVGDNAEISSHIDFAGRLINRNPWVPDDHGTHTSGTVGGAGIINVKNHGMAPKATIISQYFSDIITNTPSYIADYNMVLTNNSYHAAANGCPGSGNYNMLSNIIDRQIAGNNQLLHVFAAGNDGTQTCSPLSSSFGTVKSGWQAGKNVLTVGATNAADYSIAYFSSRGPMKDGRIKPEISCNGWAVVSTVRNNAYAANWGTSMAAPGVTGAMALMYERYRQTHAGANPSSALMKALVCNTAEDLGNAGPDYTFGFGMLNARKAVEAIDSSRYFMNNIANAANTVHTITIPANTRRVKIMLYWADSAAASNAAVSLVNDLDLTVTDPSFILHRPLILNPSSPTSVATEAADHINNIEQVTIDNPAAGNYTIRVNGFAVPFGPQQYVVTYEIIKPAVTVEYPCGGETLVPGETENIRWSGYGNESNNYTVEYSANNGNSWTTINNAVPSSSRSIAWTVPSTVTDSALIRVNRNGTALSGQSKFNFLVLGRPGIIVASVCEGAVQITWTSVTNADSYDVLQLVGDSMQVVGNSTGNSFVVTGLNKNTTYWFGVAAKKGNKQGRRSLSVNVIPTGGPCSLPDFNNDLKVDSILEPNTARQQFSNAANATRPVKIVIRNLGTSSVSGPFDLSYSYGAATVTETVNVNIGPGGAYLYTFSGAYPVIATGFRYDFRAWVTKTADANHLNDTAYKTVKYINNDPITVLPLSEGFETMPAAQYTKAEMAIGENKYIDFLASTKKGRVSSFVNTGIALSGNRALTMDQSPYTDVSNTDSVILNYNLQSFSGKQLRFDFYYKNHGQPDSAGNKVWIRGSENSQWVKAYDLYENQADLGQWKKGIININDALAGAIPAQSITPTFQLKLGQEGNTSANSPNPDVDIDDGYTFDNLKVSEALNDVAVASITSPDKGGCSLSATTPVSVRIKNYNNVALNNLSVSYQVNGGAIVTESIPSIAPNQLLDFVFAQTANLAAYIDYKVNVWVKYGADSYAANDSVLDYFVHNSPVISSYPYLESFENSDGYFYTTGKNTSWEWGAPAKTIINKAANGNKVWTNSLAGSYNDNETSYLVSPCFSLNGLINPVLSFSHIYDVEVDYDYTWVEYSTDGITWRKLGTATNGTNWYDNSGLQNWNGTNSKWQVASYDIPVSETNIRFRFVLKSDGGVTQEGIGIDDVRIHEKAGIGIQTVGQLVPADTNWHSLQYGDASPFNIVAEINTNAQDLGTVTVTPWTNAGSAIRFSGGEYLLDKSFDIHAAKPFTGPVKLRLYFTDAQANSLINATGCSTCESPADAYELRVTNYYSGTASELNGDLNDNFSGYYQFIPAGLTRILPHGEGYYAEFTVNNLGEFWFGKALIKPVFSSLCQGDTIIYAAPTGGSSYQWQEDAGSGFVNIADGANYNGTGSDTLRLINLPTSYSGRKYRCITDAVTGNPITLRFTNIWKGTVSTNWFIAANWSCGAVPDQYTDVVIPGGVTNYPVINASTAIKSIRVQPSSPVLLSGGAILDIRGKW